MEMNSLFSHPHDRATVRLLQNAHADHIEASYRGLLSLANNPEQVIIQHFGPVRTFIAAGHRFENRAIFTRAESPEQIDAVLQHFIARQSNLVIEINPANFYVDPPRTWEKRLLNHLLVRGCRIEDFRCVWFYRKSDELTHPHRINAFLPHQVDEYIHFATQVDASAKWTAANRAAAAIPGKLHYVAFDESGTPAAVGGLFINNQAAYLSWWYTRPECRGQGFQRAGIQRRVRDALAAGCTHMFSVTDFNYASPRNLQACGFALAYNYLLLRRDPLPLEPA
ncbi:MAG TPA: GNAT family N-acetyltransferase [Tepidisphaeraceae bacterium]|jgi:hypothetical protein